MKNDNVHWVRARVLNISRQKIRYWYKDAKLFTPSYFTEGGHARYTFEDLKSLKTIQLLRNKGVSVKKIKRTIERIKEKFPNIRNPLTEVNLMVVGGEIVIVQEGRVYDGLSCQGYLLKFIKVENWAGEVIELNKLKGGSEELESEFFVEAKVNLV
jgi:DNA-binding transcriptional MerR regulator